MMLIPCLVNATDDELRELSAIIRKEWKTRCEADPYVYVIERQSISKPLDAPRYMTNRNGHRAFGTSEISNPFIMVSKSLRWAEFVLETWRANTKNPSESDLKYKVTPWTKYNYEALPCYRTFQLNILYKLKDSGTLEQAEQAHKFLVKCDNHTFSGCENPRDEIKTWLASLDTDD